MDKDNSKIVELESILSSATSERRGPWTDRWRVKIIIVASLKSEISVGRTLISVLDSTVQNFNIDIVGSDPTTRNILSLWTKEDPRISYKDNIPQCEHGEKYTLVIPSGILFTRYSIEAILETSVSNSIGLLRVSVDGHRTSVEFWNETLNNKSLSPPQIEADLRSRDLERWVSGEELGIYSYGKLKPKPFFGKGPAGQHTLQIVAYDSVNKALRSEIFQEERRLLNHVQKLEAEIRTTSKNGDGVKSAIFRIKMRKCLAKIRRG